MNPLGPSWRRLAAALVICASSGFAVTTSNIAHAATPPACGYIANRNEVQCITVNAAGPRGAISVIGDSVLVGSGKFSSTVQSLPELLAADGWGPISFEAGVGYRTSLAKTKLASWKAKGWDAPVVAVNLGANDFGFCANKADPTGCNRAAITLLMDAIGPDRLVWWAKITTFNAKDMNAWNTALEQIAFTHPNLLVWDWPTALANANPPIGMSWDRIHALSPAEYEKRSHLMRDSIRQQASTADFNGGYAAPPAAVGSPLRFHPLNNARALAPTRVAGGTVLTVDMSGVVTDPAAQAVSITLGAQSSARLGYITAYPCDNAQPFASHLNLATDSSRAAQAVVRLSASRTLCLFSLSDTDVTVDVQGWFAPSAALAFVPMTPVRLLDTREPFPQPPDQTVRTLTAPAGAQAVALSLVGLDALSGGSLRVWPCDEAQPPADNLVYRPNEIVAGATYVKVSAAGTVCVQNTATAHAVVDITGAFFPGSPAGGLRLQPAQVTRLLDTRSSLGGWVGRHGIGQPISAQPAPAEAQAVTGTLTMVGPATSSFLTAYPCDVARPLASTGNAARGTDMANTITVGLSADHKVCLYSSQNEATVFDVAGWWVP